MGHDPLGIDAARVSPVKRQSVNGLFPGTFVFWLYESSSILASWLAGLSNPLPRAAASCNSPTGQEKSCLLREAVEAHTLARAHAGQTAKRYSVSRVISGNQRCSLANNPSSGISGVLISHVPPGSAINRCCHPVTSAGIVLANLSCGERASSQGIGGGRLSSTRRLIRAAVKPGCARRSTAFNGSTECEALIATYCSTLRREPLRGSRCDRC
jgi:hypothetical protein